MYSEIVKNPTQELVDELLLTIVEKTEEQNEVERRYYEMDHYIENLIDDEYMKIKDD